jgi:hypothetical protein
MTYFLQLHQAAYERNELLRSTFIAKVGRDYKPEQLIFMDEASKDERTLSRGYGYSLKNTFAIKKNVFVRGVRYTILPALSLQGIIAVDIMEGSCTKEKFKEFVISNVVCMVSLVC